MPEVQQQAHPVRPSTETVAQYLNQNYPLLEQQTGVDVKTDFWLEASRDPA